MQECMIQQISRPDKGGKQYFQFDYYTILYKQLVASICGCSVKVLAAPKESLLLVVIIVK